MKSILVVYYTQSGQLKQILDSFLAPLNNSDYTITWHQINPRKPYAFPWKPYDFYDSFPESVNEVPCALHEPKIAMEQTFDLVVLAHQPWFLSPSIPVHSFLQTDYAKQWLNQTPVVTVIGARNMWIGAQESIKRSLSHAKGKLIGNVVFRDRTENFTGIVTIARWLFTGKKRRVWGILPKPGVSDKDIGNAYVFGKILKEHLENNHTESLQDKIIEAGGTHLSSGLMSLEERAKRIFQFWAAFIAKKGGPGDASRRHRITFFRIYLPTGITLFGPIILLLSTVYNAITIRNVNKRMSYYKSIRFKN
ncbi:MAG: hypothetical protein R6U66_09545 [Bacteroidales bacterium]